MAELTPQERLQPALLDRLVDEDTSNHKPEPIERRLINGARLRQAVLRDLTWLFNSTRLGGPADFASYPEADKSVINYGLPALAGETASVVDVVGLEAAIKQAILDFEPRIVPATLEVEAVVSELSMDHHNVVGVQIRGQLWAQPTPLELLLRTEVDLETGKVEVRDLARGGFA